MRFSRTIGSVSMVLLGLLAATGLSRAQWDQAVSEQVTSGPDFDALGRRSLAIDDSGTLHAIYSRGILSDYGVYYISKPCGGTWSAPEALEGLCCAPGSAWLEVRKETGEAYVLAYRGDVFTLGIRRSGGWEYHPLSVPPELGVEKYAMTIDSSGAAHIAMTVRHSDPPIWQLAYGYWDGSPDFHFQLFEYSVMWEHGLFSQPDIAVRRDGRVAIAYQAIVGWNILVRVAENKTLGGTDWFSASIDPMDTVVYSESLEITPRGDLHLAFFENVDLGLPTHVYHAVKRANGPGWEPAQEISGPYQGMRPKMAVTDKGIVHIVFEETHRARATGRLIYVTEDRGVWRQSVLMDDQAFSPTLVLDPEGNGSLLFEHQVVQRQDNDITYYGHVAE